MSIRLKNKLLARIFSAMPSLAARWGRKSESTGGEIPWTAPLKPLSEARVALVTTGGVHLEGHTPFDMEDADGDPTWREVPMAPPAEGYVITHDYFNHSDADKDVNLVFPAERLRELVERGVIGALHEVGYSFMGHIDGEHLDPFQRNAAPEVARRLADAKVDYALLVPA